MQANHLSCNNFFFFTFSFPFLQISDTFTIMLNKLELLDFELECSGYFVGLHAPYTVHTIMCIMCIVTIPVFGITFNLNKWKWCVSIQNKWMQPTKITFDWRRIYLLPCIQWFHFWAMMEMLKAFRCTVYYTHYTL